MRLLLGLAVCLASSLSQQALEENVSRGIRQFTTNILSDLGKLSPSQATEHLRSVCDLT